jgi:hypothetical protein
MRDDDKISEVHHARLSDQYSIWTIDAPFSFDSNGIMELMQLFLQVDRRPVTAMVISLTTRDQAHALTHRGSTPLTIA